MADTARIAAVTATAAGIASLAGTVTGEAVAYWFRRKERADVRRDGRRTEASEMVKASIMMARAINAAIISEQAMPGEATDATRREFVYESLRRLAQTGIPWRPHLIDDDRLAAGQQLENFKVELLVALTGYATAKTNEIPIDAVDSTNQLAKLEEEIEQRLSQLNW